jgi:hypothetical protein
LEFFSQIFHDLAIMTNQLAAPQLEAHEVKLPWNSSHSPRQNTRLRENPDVVCVIKMNEVIVEKVGNTSN